MSGKKASFSVRPFEKLRKTMEQSSAVGAPAPPCQKRKEEYTDEELFCSEMRSVQEIESFRTLSCAHRLRRAGAVPQQRHQEQETLAILSEIIAGQRPIHLPDTQEYVEWVSPDCYGTDILKLHEGHFSVQSFLDLHGCTVPEAKEELDLFMTESFKKGLWCVKIIHGRGLRSTKGARIKEAITTRLAGHFRKDIIAYVTARQCDGGLGALYVLLRKK